MTTRDRTYKGRLIQGCYAYAYTNASVHTHGGRWVVRTIEHGRWRMEDQCPHFQTLAAAKEAINQDHA